jgi:hypothetical protein
MTEIIRGEGSAVKSHGGSSHRFAKEELLKEETIQRIMTTGVPRESANLIVNPLAGRGSNSLKSELGW